MAVYSIEELGLNKSELSNYRKEYIVTLGFQRADFSEWRKKWKALSANATRRGVTCLLSFIDYMNLAKAAGIKHPTQIGLRMDQYQMARPSDSGDYCIGNCRFVLASVNLEEKMLNGGVERSKRKISSALSGRTKELDASKAAASLKLTGRSKLTHEHLALIAYKRSMEFRIIDPDGTVHAGRNLSQFCKDHGLAASSMREVCRGERSNYKGWVGEYTSVWEGGKWKP